MTDVTFGSGDYGSYNNWVKQGGAAFYTNWNSNTYGPATANAGRIINLAARWDYASSLCAGTVGHGDMWDGAGNLVATTVNYATSGQADGFVETMHVSGAGSSATGGSPSLFYYWVTVGPTYYIGFQRDSSKCHIFGFRTGGGGGYAGKTGTDSNNGGGTAAYGGAGNGGLPGYATTTINQVYVRRVGAWQQAFAYTSRSSVWNGGSGPEFVNVRRSGAMTVVNWLQQEGGLPPHGAPIEVNVGEGWEPGWMVDEGEVGWFGSVDPTTQSFDWNKPGHYEWEDRPWTGRYSSDESNEIAERRLEAMYEWDKALKLENYQGAKLWYPKFQSSPPLEAEELATSMACGC